jgi:phytoene dehydrogenase-like protein
MSQSIIIIGAGIAGLSAGCYARMNGYDATIFELHSQPGGLCTAWNRKGYTFDGCIHYLFGSGRVSRSTTSGRSWARCRIGRWSTMTSSCRSLGRTVNASSSTVIPTGWKPT